VPAAALQSLDPAFVQNVLKASGQLKQMSDKEAMPEKEKDVLKAIGAGAFTHTNIGKFLGVDRSTIAGGDALKALVTKGFVKNDSCEFF
jgi:DNA-binding NarL/FixJ family response regulator